MNLDVVFYARTAYDFIPHPHITIQGCVRGVSKIDTKSGNMERNLEGDTLKNRNYRRVWSSGSHLQVVLMCLIPGEEVRWENHTNIDQFIRVGRGRLTIQIREKGVVREMFLHDGGAYIIQAGTDHRLINQESRSHVKLYTIYSQVEHPSDYTEVRQVRV